MNPCLPHTVASSTSNRDRPAGGGVARAATPAVKAGFVPGNGSSTRVSRGERVINMRVLAVFSFFHWRIRIATLCT